jgi:hypothetical protein
MARANVSVDDRAKARARAELIAELEEMERRDPASPEQIAAMARALGAPRATVAKALEVPRARAAARSHVRRQRLVRK